ncbi:MAG: hypothetical protein C4329_11970 [Chitinophagaceae bacterium]
MKAASVNEITQALKNLSRQELIELCLRLARYKKENKELLTYLLFEAADEQQYITKINEGITDGFTEVNTTNVYYAKKTIRKILRIANKFIRYSGSKTIGVEVLLHYCTNFKRLNLKWQRSTALSNLYQSQLKKIKTAIAGMHEDLQHDYLRQLKRLEIE